MAAVTVQSHLSHICDSTKVLGGQSDGRTNQNKDPPKNCWQAGEIRKEKKEVTGASEKCSGTFLLLFNEVSGARVCFTGKETGGARGEQEIK